MQIYLGGKSYVGTHHGGTVRKVHGQGSLWAFVAILPPG